MKLIHHFVVSLLAIVLLAKCSSQCPEGQRSARELRASNGKAYEETVCVADYKQSPYTPFSEPSTAHPLGAGTHPPGDDGTKATREASFIEGKWHSQQERKKYSLVEGINTVVGTLEVITQTYIEFLPGQMRVRRNCELVPAGSTVEAEGSGKVEASVSLPIEIVESEIDKAKTPVIRVKSAALDKANLSYKTAGGKKGEYECKLEFRSADMEFLTYNKPIRKLVLPYLPYSSSSNPWVEGSIFLGRQYEFFQDE